MPKQYRSLTPMKNANRRRGSVRWIPVLCAIILVLLAVGFLFAGREEFPSLLRGKAPSATKARETATTRQAPSNQKAEATPKPARTPTGAPRVRGKQVQTAKQTPGNNQERIEELPPPVPLPKRSATPKPEQEKGAAGRKSVEPRATAEPQPAPAPGGGIAGAKDRFMDQWRKDRQERERREDERARWRERGYSDETMRRYQEKQ